MSYFFPLNTKSKVKPASILESFLYQILLPDISNTKNRSKAFKFLKNEDRLEELFKKNNGLIQLSPSFGCDFESSVKNTSKEGKKEHLEFIQNLSPEKLAVMTPFIRMYIVPKKFLNNPKDFKSNLIPISFSKEFDTDFYLKRQRGLGNALATAIPGQGQDTVSTSRGETAAILDLSLSRNYNTVGAQDFYNVNVKFYFSSFNVFAYKPAVEKQFLTGFGYGGDTVAALGASNVRYSKLIEQNNNDFQLVLHYGYTVDRTVSESIFPFSERSIIENFEQRYVAIKPYQNDISFDEFGGVTLNVTYSPEIDNILLDTIKFPTKIFENKEVFNIVQKDMSPLEINLSNQLEQAQKELKVANKNQVARKKLTSKVRSLKTKIAAYPAFRYAQLLGDLLNKEKSVYDLSVSGNKSGKGIDSKYTFNVTLKDGDKKTEILRETYTLKKIKKQVEKIKLERKDEKDLLILKDDKFLELTVSRMLPSMTTSSIKFVFLRDLISAVVKISNVDKNMPPIIFDNFPMILPDGKRYWCNMGDIPIRFKRIKGILQTFLVQSPGGDLRDFLKYIFSVVVPNTIVEEEQKKFLPQFSFNYVNFDISSWKSDNKNGKKAKELFLDGDKGDLIDFAKDYLDSSDAGASKHCIYVGVNPDITQQDTSLSLGTELPIDSDLFKNDDKLLKAGVVKTIIGNPRGVVQQINFSGESSEMFTNFLYAYRGSDKSSFNASSISNYNCTVQMYGNFALDFPGRFYIPAASIGYSPDYKDGERDRLLGNDFEIGGIYTIQTKTDTLSLTNMTYSSTVSGFQHLRESERSKREIKEKVDSNEKQKIIPTNSPKITISDYLYEQSGEYEQIYVKKSRAPVPSATPRVKSAADVGVTLPGSTPAPTPAPPPGGLFGRQAGGFKQFPEG